MVAIFLDNAGVICTVEEVLKDQDANFFCDGIAYS